MTNIADATSTQLELIREITLETSRLLLRPMQVQDTDALLRIFSDPKVMASFGVEPFTREQMERWVRRNLEHQVQFGYGLFSVMLKSEEMLIGDCGLERMELDGVVADELGYDFRSDYWNQGFATEAAVAVRDYAFQILQRPQLISLIRVGNHASRRVAEKIGMQLMEEFLRFGQPYWKFALEYAPSRRSQAVNDLSADGKPAEAGSASEDC